MIFYNNNTKAAVPTTVRTSTELKGVRLLYPAYKSHLPTRYSQALRLKAAVDEANFFVFHLTIFVSMSNKRTQIIHLSV